MIDELMLRLGAEDLRPTGEGFECRCPVCNSDRRSFRVAYIGKNGRPGAFTCHKCHVNGDLIGLTMRALHVPRGEALELAKNSGDWIVANKKHKTQYVLPGLEDIAPYRKTLSAYLVDERGLDIKAVAHYRIGMDSFTNEIVIPTYNWTGSLVGITRRVGVDGAPYIHSQFPKSEHVFGLNFAVGEDVIYVTEGQLDPLGLMPFIEYGEAAVAINGSHMSEDQAELLVETRATVVLAFDNDRQGLICTHQSIELLRRLGQQHIEVLLYPGSDPGKLPLLSDVTLARQSTVAWLSQKKNRNPLGTQRKRHNSYGTQRRTNG